MIYGLLFILMGMFIYYLLVTYSEEASRSLPRMFSNIVRVVWFVIKYTYYFIAVIFKSIFNYFKPRVNPLRDFSKEDQIVENLKQGLEEDRVKYTMYDITKTPEQTDELVKKMKEMDSEKESNEKKETDSE